ALLARQEFDQAQEGTRSWGRQRLPSLAQGWGGRQPPEQRAGLGPDPRIENFHSGAPRLGAGGKLRPWAGEKPGCRSKPPATPVSRHDLMRLARRDGTVEGWMRPPKFSTSTLRTLLI